MRSSVRVTKTATLQMFARNQLRRIVMIDILLQILILWIIGRNDNGQGQ
jgi:hypothetical protein